MIRKYLFSEEFGRNIIWVMLSGFFLKIGAKENTVGQIVMPKDHYLFNLDDKKINNEYLKYKKKYPGLTKFVDSVQISGSKVFEWKWIIVKK